VAGISFEWTVKFGDVLTLLGAIAVAASFLYRRGGQETGVQMTLQQLAMEFTNMQVEIKKISDVLINQADQNRRIIHLEEDVRDLRHGRGFVQGDRGIDREYPQAVR
jgi:hypothetical protein